MKRWEAINEIQEKPESLRAQALGIFAYSLLESMGVNTESVVFDNIEEVYEKIENYLNEPVIMKRDIDNFIEKRRQEHDQLNSR